jgi:hypothetical protein
MCRFLAYNTNAYVLRSSVSFDENATVCGASMAVSPEGKVLANMGGKFGMLSVDFDPLCKYLKPAGFGNPEVLPWVEEFRSLDLSHGDGSDRIWDYLYETIRNHKAFPVTLEQSYKVIEVIEKARLGTIFEA